MDSQVNRPIRPVDAASLIVYRRAQGRVEVLMGRRHARHVFMPGLYVFPGGRVDAGDRFVKPATDLHAEVARLLERSATASRARALAIAAVRETMEETGLMVARPADPPSIRRAGPWQAFHRHGLGPALDCLTYVFRAITPPGPPRRFNARFFIADNRCLHGEMRPSEELEDVRWIPLADLNDLPVHAITRTALREAGWAWKGDRISGYPRAVPVHFGTLARRRRILE